MDTARLAEQSWPDRNYQSRRPWSPPQKRKRQGLDTPAPSENPEVRSNNEYSPTNEVEQQTTDFAMRRAARIDRVADLLLSIGRTDAAERLSHEAAQIRTVSA